MTDEHIQAELRWTQQKLAEWRRLWERERRVLRIVQILTLVVSLAGILSILATAAIQLFTPSRVDTVQSRIETLSRSLNEAASVITEIEQEVSNRMDLVSELEQRARVAEQLQSANREQVEAISLLLRTELDRKENWNFWLNVLQNAIFMIIGAFLGYFVERWMRKRRTTASGAEAG